MREGVDVPRRALTSCLEPGCPALVERGYCDAHRPPRAPDARPSASARGYGARWRVLRDAYLAEHPRCVVCGGPADEVDHVVPKARGGSDDRSNLRAMCHRDHARRTARDSPGGWNRR